MSSSVWRLVFERGSSTAQRIWTYAGEGRIFGKRILDNK